MPTTTCGNGMVPDAGSSSGADDEAPSIPRAVRPPDVQPTGHEVDVLGREADEFGPPQAGVGQDRHYCVALVAVRATASV
ncbi:MAG: hypothetical protein H6521_14085 [Mycolicibacterium sp.]|nr:hypothetical protein [Mycolicibacterium sp.]